MQPFLDYFVGRNSITCEDANLVLTFPRGNRTEAVCKPNLLPSPA